MTTQKPPSPSVTTHVPLQDGGTHVWTDADGRTHGVLYLHGDSSLNFHDPAQVRDLIGRLAALAGEIDAEVTRQQPAEVRTYTYDGPIGNWAPQGQPDECLCGPDQTGDDIDVNPDCPQHAPSERDSDVQPDPYIDAIAAEYVQEYEPEPLLVCALCGATDLVLMCVSGPRCHNRVACAERVAARNAEAAQAGAR